jgi:hypothetical protein
VCGGLRVKRETFLVLALVLKTAEYDDEIEDEDEFTRLDSPLDSAFTSR